MQTEVYERARLARDPHYDGRFFVAVRTTGIYCRPICPAVPPKRENVTFYPTAAAAGEAGYRPCLRCRPECAPGTPAWAGTSTTVRRGLRLIDNGALDAGSVESLAERLGVTSRHLRRLFTTHVGASPQAVAHTRRLHFAKRLIDDTDLPMRYIALAAGYGSVRRFNDAFRNTYGRPPRELRRLQDENNARLDGAALTVRLACRAPFDWQAVLAFYAARAIPGVESIEDERYRRVLPVGGRTGIVEIAPDKRPDTLALTLRNVPAEYLFEVVQKARDVFDVDAPTADIHAALRSDARLQELLAASPGIRVPGCWDGFELAVRAIVGQQISVKAATTISGRIAARYGKPLPAADGELTHSFPTAAALRRARFNKLGLVSARAATLRALAAAVDDGSIHFDPLQDTDEFRRRLLAIKGIGDWTVQYVLMRALKHPDAFPAADLGLQKGLTSGERVSARDLEVRAAAWRPWRAYAAMLLWSANPVSGG